MASKGLSPKTFQGLNKKRMEKGGGNFDRLKLDQGETVTVQFLTEIDGFLEYEIHTFRDGKRWNYVPCAGDDCPLCDDEDAEVSKTSYRFCANVYSHRDKKVLIMEGPKDLAGRIAFRFEKCKKKPGSFLKNTWDVSKFATTPVSYDVERGDDRPVRTEGMKGLDLMKYVTGAMERYFGDDMPSGSKKKSSSSKRSSLDDDWEDDDDAEDDEAFTKDELLEMGPSALKEVANDLGIKVKKVTKENRKKLIKAILAKQ